MSSGNAVGSAGWSTSMRTRSPDAADPACLELSVCEGVGCFRPPIVLSGVSRPRFAARVPGRHDGAAA